MILEHAMPRANAPGRGPGREQRGLLDIGGYCFDLTAAPRPRDPVVGVFLDHLERIEREIAAFHTISLEKIGAAALMDRVDTKFLLPIRVVPDVLRECTGQYQVLEVGGRRLCRYQTMYFDTPDLALYHAHHNGRATRRKVRIRNYLEVDQQYLEVKLRTNKGRTSKSRVRVRSDAPNPLASLNDASFADIAGDLCGEKLRAVVNVDYTRVTLVSTQQAERVTLDLFAEFSAGANKVAYPWLVVAEVKQERSGESCFGSAMRKFGLRPGSISKYCLGVASLDPSAKKNLFKSVLHRVQETRQSNVHPIHAL